MFATLATVAALAAAAYVARSFETKKIGGIRFTRVAGFTVTTSRARKRPAAARIDERQGYAPRAYAVASPVPVRHVDERQGYGFRAYR